MVNNTANYRDKCFLARSLVEAGELGEINSVLCVMYSPLMFLFDDPRNTGWVKARPQNTPSSRRPLLPTSQFLLESAPAAWSAQTRCWLSDARAVYTARVF